MRPGKKTRPRGGDNSYWTSYSDMMAGMLFVFALILFAAVYQLVDLQQKKTIELQTKEAQLSTQQSLLIDQEAELKDKEELLAATTLALQQQQEELDQNRTALTSAQDSLALQQSKIEEQAALLAAQQAQIDKLVGLRSQIIEDLRDNLSDVGQRVTVDQVERALAAQTVDTRARDHDVVEALGLVALDDHHVDIVVARQQLARGHLVLLARIGILRPACGADKAHVLGSGLVMAPGVLSGHIDIKAVVPVMLE